MLIEDDPDTSIFKSPPPRMALTSASPQMSSSRLSVGIPALVLPLSDSHVFFNGTEETIKELPASVASRSEVGAVILTLGS